MSTLKSPSLFEWLEILRKCSGDYLKDLVQSIGPDIEARMPKDFLDSLDIGDQVICFRASLVCYGVTGSTQVPREMQLRAVLADQDRKDCLVAAVMQLEMGIARHGRKRVGLVTTCSHFLRLLFTYPLFFFLVYCFQIDMVNLK